MDAREARRGAEEIRRENRRKFNAFPDQRPGHVGSQGLGGARVGGGEVQETRGNGAESVRCYARVCLRVDFRPRGAWVAGNSKA